MEIKGIKIVSAGTVMGTRVYTTDGEDLTNKLHIRGIKWSHNAGGIPMATLDCTLAAIDGIVAEEGVVEVTDFSSEFHEYELRKGSVVSR